MAACLNRFSASTSGATATWDLFQDGDRSTYARTRRLFDAGCGCRKVELQPNLPRAHGDERKLTQVLLNLVGNAIKFTDEGEVAIKAAAANGSITVSVRASGPGITEADQDTILPEISASRLAITRDKGGTGLGLTISKRIVKLHWGADLG